MDPESVGKPGKVVVPDDRKKAVKFVVYKGKRSNSG